MAKSTRGGQHNPEMASRSEQHDAQSAQNQHIAPESQTPGGGGLHPSAFESYFDPARGGGTEYAGLLANPVSTPGAAPASGVQTAATPAFKVIDGTGLMSRAARQGGWSQ